MQRYESISQDKEIILVLPENQTDYWEGLCFKHQFSIPHKVAFGGIERFHSVKNGLNKISEKSKTVVIHDAVRPFVSSDVIKKLLNETEKYPAVIPVIPVFESIRKVTENGNSEIANRNEFVLVQTPQCFQTEIIKKAYTVSFSPTFTDDASVAEHAGYSIKTIEGNRENIKLTTPLDLKIAQCLFSEVI
jgi:2-C-methyl-D-erythritol 4-phosphate cytidylyltransferase